MEIILNSLRTEWQGLLAAAPRVGFAVAIFVLFWLVGRLVAKALQVVLARSQLPNTYFGFFRRVLVWVFILIGLALSLKIVGLGGVAAGLLTGGGITAVVLGFAFREIGENFLAGLFLAFSPPFNHGDLIESGGLQGVVKNIQLRSTHIRTYDGCDVYIPSSQLFKNPLYNYTRDGLRRLSFTIGIAYADDADAACALMQETISASGIVLDTPAPFVGIANFTTNYVELVVRFWIDAFNRPPNVADQRSAIMGLCRRALIDAGHTLSADVSQSISLTGDAT